MSSEAPVRIASGFNPVGASWQEWTIDHPFHLDRSGVSIPPADKHAQQWRGGLERGRLASHITEEKFACNVTSTLKRCGQRLKSDCKRINSSGLL